MILHFICCIFAEYILSELYAEFCEDDIAEASEGSGEDEESQMVT